MDPGDMVPLNELYCEMDMEVPLVLINVLCKKENYSQKSKRTCCFCPTSFYFSTDLLPFYLQVSHSQRTLSSRLWCTQALACIVLPVDNVNSQGFNVSLLVHHFVKKILSWHKCRGSKNKKIFNAGPLFNGLPHISELHVQLIKQLQPRPECVVCVCAILAF
jgi:hypothetical protein